MSFITSHQFMTALQMMYVPKNGLTRAVCCGRRLGLREVRLISSAGYPRAYSSALSRPGVGADSVQKSDSSRCSCPIIPLNLLFISRPQDRFGSSRITYLGYWGTHSYTYITVGKVMFTVTFSKRVLHIRLVKKKKKKYHLVFHSVSIKLRNMLK